MHLRHMFIDFNAFFASVEQQVQPGLRGRPVGVAATMTDSGCCIATSYEARVFGIKTGTRVGEARALCRDVAIVPARPRLYVMMHQRFLKAIDTVIPVHKVHSIDEVDCLLDPTQRTAQRATELALAVKRAVRKHCGVSMRCSIGCASNRVLAKLGTDMMKPDGLVILPPDEIRARIGHLSVDELSGIGPGMTLRLERAGIKTVNELMARSAKEMRSLWGGLVGEAWWHILRGEEVREVRTKKSSVGHQHVLAPDLRSSESARAVAYRLLLKAAARLRHEGLAARKLSLGISFAQSHEFSSPWGGTSWGASAPLGEGCVDTPTMLEALRSLWERVPKDDKPVLVSVTLQDVLVPGNASLPLFQQETRRVDLSKAMDKVNQRYGGNTVYTANMQGVRGEGRGGIAFHVVPDLKLADSVQARQRGGEGTDERHFSDEELEAMLDAGIADRRMV